jgi:hypothetical protein
MQGMHPAARPRVLRQNIVIPEEQPENPPPQGVFIGRRTGRVFDDRIANGNDWLMKDEELFTNNKQKNMLNLYDSDTDSDNSNSVDESLQRKIDWDDLDDDDDDDDDDECSETSNDEAEEEKQQDGNDNNTQDIKKDPKSAFKSPFDEIREKLRKETQEDYYVEYSDHRDDKNESEEEASSPNFNKNKNSGEDLKSFKEKQVTNELQSNVKIPNVNINNNFLKSVKTKDNRGDSKMIKVESTSSTKERNKDDQWINNFDQSFGDNKKFNSKDQEFDLSTVNNNVKLYELKLYLLNF